MVDVTVYLKTIDGVDIEGLEANMRAGLERLYKKGVRVSVGKCRTNKPAELIFNDMSPVDVDDVEMLVDAALEGLVYSVNSLDGQKIGVTIHATIIGDVVVEIQ